MMQETDRKVKIKKTKTGYCGFFSAMASPCELLIESDDMSVASNFAQIVAKEAWRIEHTYSRYSDSNLIHQINNSKGNPVKVDAELAELLSFADQCYHISEGLFDITSGVLREIWKFDGSDNVPSRKQAKALLPRIGWNKVKWEPPHLTLPEGMQIDFGGVGKEYAVDRAAQQLSLLTELPFLINFGGDLYANKPPTKLDSWSVGIDSIGSNTKQIIIPIKSGAIATSGDANRFLLRNGVRYPHVLNPRTAWPVRNAPNSITVVADSCIQAGFLATLAMLQGKDAQQFLNVQEVKSYVFLKPSLPNTCRDTWGK